MEWETLVTKNELMSKSIYTDTLKCFTNLAHGKSIITNNGIRVQDIYSKIESSFFPVLITHFANLKAFDNISVVFGNWFIDN